MKDIIILLLILLIAGIFVKWLADVLPPRESQFDRIEAEFRRNCSAVNGRAVWDGRQWECLK